MFKPGFGLLLLWQYLRPWWHFYLQLHATHSSVFSQEDLSVSTTSHILVGEQPEDWFQSLLLAGSGQVIAWAKNELPARGQDPPSCPAAVWAHSSSLNLVHNHIDLAGPLPLRGSRHPVIRVIWHAFCMECPGKLFFNRGALGALQLLFMLCPREVFFCCALCNLLEAALFVIAEAVCRRGCPRCLNDAAGPPLLSCIFWNPASVHPS